MFFLLDGLEKWGEKELDLFTPYLSDQRKRKVESLKFLPDKIASASAFLLLRYALKENFGLDLPCIFDFSAAQKPYLSSHEDVFFSISHDRKGVGAAVSDREIGADVQTVFTYRKELAQRILSPREKSFFDRIGENDEGLTKIWTLKESMGKKTGEGVFSSLTATDFSPILLGEEELGENVFTTGKKGELFYAVCSDKKEEVRFVEEDEFFTAVFSLKKS